MRRIIAITILIIFCFIATPYAQLPVISVELDGVDVIFPDAKPFVDENSRTLIPIRFVSEAMGAEVGWKDETKEVFIDLNNKKIVLTIGSNLIGINNDFRLMDTKPIIKEARTFVPIRFVAEGLGAWVDWEDSTKTVIISTEKPLVKPPINWNSLTEEDVLNFKHGKELMELEDFSGVGNWYDVGIEFFYSQFNPDNNNAHNVAMSVAYTKDLIPVEPSGTLLQIEIDRVNEENLIKFRKILDILVPEFADFIYDTTVPKMDGSFKGSDYVLYEDYVLYYKNWESNIWDNNEKEGLLIHFDKQIK